MKLATIGAGNIGKAIGAWAAKAGYDVVFSAKEEQHAQEAAKAVGGKASAVSVQEAAKVGDMVLLAVPYTAVKDVMKEIGPLLKGKVLIDATNPLAPDYSGLAVGFTTSGAEEIQKLAPGAKVVKAFNTVFARIYQSQKPKLEGATVSVFLAGDDKDAKSKVTDLVKKMGLDPVDAGPLRAARDIEPLAMLNINLGYGMKLGTSIGFSLLR